MPPQQDLGVEAPPEVLGVGCSPGWGCVNAPAGTQPHRVLGEGSCPPTPSSSAPRCFGGSPIQHPPALPMRTPAAGPALGLTMDPRAPRPGSLGGQGTSATSHPSSSSCLGVLPPTLLPWLHIPGGKSPSGLFVTGALQPRPHKAAGRRWAPPSPPLPPASSLLGCIQGFPGGRDTEARSNGEGLGPWSLAFSPGGQGQHRSVPRTSPRGDMSPVVPPL